MKHQTLQQDGISRLPLWRGLILFLGLVLGWMLVAEFIARTPLGSELPPPSVGADSFEFDIKVFYLEQSIRQNGPLDCLIVGDSMTNNGLDPNLISQAYEAQTGVSLHCFNFGMPALTLDASGPLAQALANHFHPRLLIFVLSQRDFEIEYGHPFRHVATTDWTEYNLGKTSMRGWAVNSLYGYRYYLFTQYWLNPANRVSFSNAWRDITSRGFSPIFGFRNPPKIFPPNTTFNTDDPAAAQGFKGLLDIQNGTTSLLIVDAPLQPSYYQIVLGTPEDYARSYVEPMQAYFEPLHIPFWLTRELSLSIPDQAWHDSLHVNENGVPIFSAWLGRELAKDYPSDFFK